VAFASPTSPRVTVVGQVELTVLPVPPEAAAVEALLPLELVPDAAVLELVPDAAVLELPLEQAATAAIRTAAAAAEVSLVHFRMRGLSTVFLSPAGRPPETAGS